MKSLYIDTSNSGISGDMLLACLLSLVNKPDTILKKLGNLKNYLPGVVHFEVNLNQIYHSGILVSQLNVDIDETKKSKTPNVIADALNKFMLDLKCSKESINYANKVLNLLIKAEADVHGKLAKDIHLHELSSIDTLLDIIGTSLALEDLGYFTKEFYVTTSPLPLGGGTIRTAHGILPVPAPATLKILEKSKIKSISGPVNSEITTPTGIALLSSLDMFPNENKPIMIQQVVQSTGNKIFDNFPNILRLYYGEVEKSRFMENLAFLDNYIEEVAMIETDVDDVSGEIIGNLINILETKEILDIQVIPSATKKKRPSNIIKVLCNPKVKNEIIFSILKEIGTLGVRFQVIKRVCVERIIKTKKIQIGNLDFEIHYKISYVKTEKNYEIINIKPEFEDLKKISNKVGLPIKIVEMYAQEKLIPLKDTFYKELVNNINKKKKKTM